MSLIVREIDFDELKKAADALETEKDKKFEDIEAKYKTRYAFGVCNFLRQRYPEEFKEAFGEGEEGMKNCLNTFETAADVYFDEWDTNYVEGVLARARATMLMLAQKRKTSSS